ncbi:YfaZ family outer membrane protein [Sinimarinibacterium sp. NLF-5-8]|uniref:YfaZ family outer membrane protein n=1 Tax=Sinimarinibacterium sp. NLF-5-8 TaxID=2698684 RepID=UPI00137BE9B7|nr:YfaZ family outer membrane protein [Sinimarinibacterium sp. NLF-5-8]QHS08741.1 hypothetical protein GT972_00360 [Sinimarinibacterium sp. NLF-5-8]
MLFKTFKAAAVAASATACAVAFSAPARADTVSLNIGEHNVALAMQGPMQRLFGGADGMYDVGALFHEYRNAHDFAMAHAGFLATGDAGARDFKLTGGLGVRAVYLHLADNNGGALAPGGFMQARVPEFERIGVMAYGYYSPSILTFARFDRYREVGLRVDYQVLRNASVYTGYRNVNLKYDAAPRAHLTVDNGWHLGMQLVF